MYLTGHTQPATTARYLRPQKAAAEGVLKAAAKVAQSELWFHSGYADHRAAQLVRRARAQRKTPNRLQRFGVSSSVRGGGLEPPWLLTASTSS
jgi:hypothetical protein